MTVGEGRWSCFGEMFFREERAASYEKEKICTFCGGASFHSDKADLDDVHFNRSDTVSVLVHDSYVVRTVLCKQ